MPYARRPLKGPRLAGRALRAAVAVLEGPLGPTVRQKILADIGVTDLRRARLDAVPSAAPDMPRGEWTGRAVDLAALVPPASSLEARREAKGFAFETTADFASAYREGTSSPVQVAERLIAAVEESERATPAMRILIAHDKADVLRQAREAQARFAAKKPLGPLDGVPVAVKDEVDMVPYPTTVGTRFLGRAPATHDATTVAKLRAAGALLFGKTNMFEIGISPNGLNPHHGACRNPYDPAHDTGGSSSGVAAAVAAGLSPIGLGADGGGSIRVPASLCGVVGLKPTFGRVSEHGAVALCWSVGHLGPIAATAADAALGYAVLAGRDEADPQSLRQPDVSLEGFLRGDQHRGDLKGVRLGVFEPWFEDADASVVRTCRALLEGLVERGAVVKTIDIPDLEQLQLAHLLTITGEMLCSQARWLDEHRQDYCLNARMTLALAESVSGADYVQAQRVRAAMQARFAEVLRDVDAIVTPTTAQTAPAYGADALETGESNLPVVDKLMRFIRPGNLLGLPSITFPAGYDEAGLPIGFMATGRPWEEALLLRMARVAEGLVHRRAPRFHRRLLPA
jgi:Asp-tRNA(Asn)/Glu-tRNA(Gln) amidotransferase A subunit family amidase